MSRKHIQSAFALWIHFACGIMLGRLELSAVVLLTVILALLLPTYGRVKDISGSPRRVQELDTTSTESNIITDGMNNTTTTFIELVNITNSGNLTGTISKMLVNPSAVLGNATVEVQSIGSYCSAYGYSGTCRTTSSCTALGGGSVAGFCPNDPADVKCCLGLTCSFSNGILGTCKSYAALGQCTGTFYTGVCPGPSDFMCCVGSSTQSSSSSTTTLQRPLCKGTEAGYYGDTGSDLATPSGSYVYAAASGTVLYSEYGHTPWQTSPDTPYSVLIQLDVPIVCGGATRYYMWYTHMSYLQYYVYETNTVATLFGHYPQAQFHVDKGTYLGNTGLGNKNAHLHFGIVTDRAQSNVCSPADIRTLLHLSQRQQFSSCVVG